MSKQVKNEKFVGFCQDPNVWNCKLICDDCLNKHGGGCYVFEEDGELPDPDGQHNAQSTGKCEWYIKKRVL